MEEAKKAKEEGNDFYKQGEYSKAIELYSKAIKLDPKEVKYLGNRSAAKQMVGKIDECIEDCELAVELDPTFKKCAMRGTQLLLHRGDFRRAAALIGPYADAMQEEDTDAAANFENYVACADAMEKGEEAFVAGDYSTARTLFIQCEKSAPTCLALTLKLAEIECKDGNFAQTLRDTIKILRKDGRNADALYLRALALYRTGSTDQAFKHLQEALRSDPDHKKAMKAQRFVCWPLFVVLNL